MNLTRPRWTTLLVLLIVPVLVAAGVLWGTASVDANLRTVQAAVVNHDEMVEINGQMVPMGRQLAAELVNSDREQNFTWIIADDEAATAGLASGEFAAVVTIPKEFSASVTSFSGDAAAATRATIQVETSPVAGISETALGRSIANAAANALNRSLTSSYLENVYLGFTAMGEQMTELSDGTDQLADGATQLSNGLDLASSAGAQLRDGAGQSASGAATLADGTNQLAGGTTQLADGAQQYATGMQTFADGTRTFADGVTAYTSGVTQIVQPVRDAVELLPEWGGLLVAAGAWIDDLPAQAAQWDAQAQAVIADVRAFVEDALGLASRASRLASAVDGAQDQASTLAAGHGVSCPASLSEVEGGCAAFAAGVAAAGESVREALGDAGSEADGLVASGADVQSAGKKVLAALDRLSAASSRFSDGATKLQAQLDDLRASIPEGTPLTRADTIVLLDQFLEASTQLSDGGQELATGAGTLSTGAQDLATGARALASGTGALASGAGQLSTGLGQLSDGVSAYTSGIDQAADGARQLADGTSQLADGVSDGVGEIPSYTDAEAANLAASVASPVATDELDALVRPGLAWVSLLLVLALWIGAMVTFAVLKPVDHHTALSTASTPRLVVRALLPGLAVVGLQAVLLAGAGAAVLKLGAADTAELTALLLLAGVVFGLVNHALAALFGNGGRVVGLIMALAPTIVALTSTAPAAVGALRGASPLSPALDAVRAAVLAESPALLTLVLVAWGLAGLGGSVIAITRARTVPLSALVA